MINIKRRRDETYAQQIPRGGHAALRQCLGSLASAQHRVISMDFVVDAGRIRVAFDLAGDGGAMLADELRDLGMRALGHQHVPDDLALTE